ncbi:hypothetical protein [Haloarcula marina]|uniref:hypothetical protein n=1 Tax=Haloarcula marina TaxID=2961574 RepID=UPI0020B7A0FA|nr:hypothetical protein [Halomicroarcula marina]
MSEIPLAHKYSAETYDQALTNLVERWERNGDGEPVKYDEAAIGMDKSTVSTALKFLGEIGLLESPKAGQYKVPEEVVDFKTKIEGGDVQKKAKHKVEDRISDYPLYSEATFYIGVNDFDLDELVTEVAGSSEVAASQDEVNDVERSIRILAELGFLEIDEEGGVSVPTDLNESADADKSSSDDSQGDEEVEETEKQTEGEEEPEAEGKQVTLTNPQPNTDENGQQEVRGQTTSQALAQAGLAVDVDISMDVTEMETNEVEDKLEIINDIFTKNGE